MFVWMNPCPRFRARRAAWPGAEVCGEPNGRLTRLVSSAAVSSPAAIPPSAAVVPMVASVTSVAVVAATEVPVETGAGANVRPAALAPPSAASQKVQNKAQHHADRYHENDNQEQLHGDFLSLGDHRMQDFILPTPALSSHLWRSAVRPRAGRILG